MTCYVSLRRHARHTRCKSFFRRLVIPLAVVSGSLVTRGSFRRRFLSNFFNRGLYHVCIEGVGRGLHRVGTEDFGPRGMAKVHGQV